MPSRSKRIPWEAVARAYVHPLRISILELLAMDGGRVMSPNEIAFELQKPMNSVAYHVTELRKSALIEVVDEVQRRGAIEHYYEIKGAA